MKLGVYTSLFSERSLEVTLGLLSGMGVETVEFYTGALFEPKHCNPDLLLNDKCALQIFKDTLTRYNMSISQLNCSGNAISPVAEEAKKHDEAFKKTVLLAELLEVEIVATFSGCPGGGPKDVTPNWITCPWPEQFLEMTRYQWEDVLVPYWREAVAFANSHGIHKIGLEMHPGFCVYNPETLLRLRAEVGNTIGANFDPSHLFWQGIDIPGAIMELGDAIFHVHAKDTRIFDGNVKKNGVLDAKHYGQMDRRAWVFATVGYGHGEEEWKRIIDSLSMVGYDYVVSIEHEDSLKSREEGLQMAYAFLNGILPKEKPEQMWWA